MNKYYMIVKKSVIFFVNKSDMFTICYLLTLALKIARLYLTSIRCYAYTSRIKQPNAKRPSVLEVGLRVLTLWQTKEEELSAASVVNFSKVITTI